MKFSPWGMDAQEHHEVPICSTTANITNSGTGIPKSGKDGAVNMQLQTRQRRVLGLKFKLWFHSFQMRT